MGENALELAKILIVDDQEYNISLLERILRRAQFIHLHSTTDPTRVDQLMEEIDPDIVLLDMHMPGMDGLEVLAQIRERTGDEHYLPVLVLTADTTSEMKQKALQTGANDFLTKPFDRTEVLLRIRNLLSTRQLHVQLQQYNETLEARVRERTEELEQAKTEILHLLERTSEYRDDITGQHTRRVGRLSEMIARRLGLSEPQVEMIREAAPLHDIGKIGIPDEILLKPGRFEPHEFERMKGHTKIGANILDGSRFTVLRMAHAIARSHHEKWDGSGYPDGLKGEEIPIEARIVALADFYDALTNDRPYKKAWSPLDALSEVVKQRGVHFDPQIVDVFVALFHECNLSDWKGE
ncbi:HD domain-containing phosphohydrolase [Paenibacillus hamazuiensis]|uniref:HD domain-containing phosphohydrolase n=1 Tax=Paenibacillus hamazuiensis TaxID=2936508 RepID=UPI00200CC293|nr:HD domain-containing phosphohydrolase [Paenibacillus hamazuiensis]